MSKVLKWALASGEMALFVCHSAEHYFTEKTFLSKFADEEKRDKKKDGVWVLEVTHGGTQCLGHCGSLTLTFGHGGRRGGKS